MKKPAMTGAEKYEKEHRRKHIWHRVISVLSAITVFITTYAMILPAITMEPSPGIRLDQEFRYEDDRILMIFHVKGRAEFENKKEAPLALSEDKVTLSVTPLEKESSARWAYLTYAQDYIRGKDLCDLLTMRVTFRYEGAKLDVDNCNVDVQIVSKSHIGDKELWAQTPASQLTALSTVLNPKDLDKDQVMAITAYQGVSSDISQQNTGYQVDGSPVLTVTTRLTGDTLAVATYATVNPTFTVQYYTYFDRLADTGDRGLDVIDTSGGKLPVNGGPNSMIKIWLDSIGGDKYVLATQQELGVLERQVNDFEYVKAPSVVYVDKLRQNGNYQLDEVWVLKSGKSQTSTRRSDWNIYPANVSFTNREESAGSNRIYISEGTVIRLVYSATEGTYTNDADFYDYDISDGYTKSGGVTTAVTANNGINSFTAARNTIKYAFGNSNTKTDFGGNVWVNNGKNNTLNAFNTVNEAYGACTFGIVTGINEDGTLVFAKGISAPELFGKADGKGKTYFDDYSLQFSRSGDTYTLVAVNGTNAQNLDHLNSPSFTYNGSTTNFDHIVSNNFWPMDSVYTWGAAGHDPIFGSAHNAYNNLVRATNGRGDYETFPVSDDGLNHNSYFGMQYQLTFTLTEDYMGPLEYVFYGDDDMWVFLDGQLVCDIGGVHSSVGQYVNLRDYIDKMPEDQKYGEHTLYFCYTERGASGSTCYMRFTLPSVSIDAPQVETSNLEVSKEVLNMNTDEEFDFEITLTDAAGNPLIDDYAYTRYDADGNPIENGIIKNSTIVKLRNDERIEINYLPKGTKFIVREIPSEGYFPSHRVNDSTSIDSGEAEGDLDSSVSVHFINSTSVILPETGGRGVIWYVIPFALATGLFIATPLLERKWKRRSRTKQ